MVRSQEQCEQAGSNQPGAMTGKVGVARHLAYQTVDILHKAARQEPAAEQQPSPVYGCGNRNYRNAAVPKVYQEVRHLVERLSSQIDPEELNEIDRLSGRKKLPTQKKD